MTFISKLCILAVIAFVHASPKMEHRAENDSGYDWSKFLGKVPNYFKGPESLNELQTVNQAEASAPNAAQNDEIANDGGSSYPNPSQINENKWQDYFRKCMESSYGQTSSNSGGTSSGSTGGTSSGSTGGSGQYGTDQISNYANAESFNKHFSNCHNQVSSSLGSYPGNNGGEQFFSQFKPPNFPTNFGSYTSALTGSSSSASA